MVFILVTTSMPLSATAATSSGPLFSMTLLAPTSNPIRRQWAAIITNSLDGVNINANLVFVSFDVLLADLFGCPSGCPPATYANGGWDAGFIGDSASPLPDYGTQNAVLYRDLGAGDLPPIGSDYYFFDNATYNSLATQYNQDFNPTSRIPILQQMVSIIMQQRPAMILFYESAVYVWSSDLTDWGSADLTTAVAANQEFSHWKSASGATTLNIGETGDIGAVDQYFTSAQNSYYSGYLAFSVQGLGEFFNPVTFAYYPGTVAAGNGQYGDAVTTSADHLTYTVREVPHTFSDGVSVTSNDYIYFLMGGLINEVGFVAEGTLTSIIGANSSFTFLNGTSDYVSNGVFFHSTPPAGFSTASGSTFKALNSTSWTFTLPAPYLFADPVITGNQALPLHVYDNYPFSAWTTGDLAGFTGAGGGMSTSPFTYTYKTSIYGGSGGDTTLKAGNGTGQSWGPIGDGPYIYHGYDPVALVGTLVQNPTYFNITGLQAMGYDKISTVHVVYINNKDAAVAALADGTVNFLDSNYEFNSQDVASLKAQGFHVIIATDPSTGWQEMGLNMENPVFGTGTATPLGTSTPSQAAYAARLVREAISYLIPRTYIVSTLLGGIGTPGITQFNPAFPYAYPAGSVADPYDPTYAKALLATAGYSTGVPPIQVGGGLINLTPSTIAGVSVPSFLLGNTFTLTGTFKVDPVVGAKSGGFAVTLQQYTTSSTCPDTNDSCWTPVALGSTNAGGYFDLNYAPPATGSFEYRIFLTGLPESLVTSDGINSPASAELLVPPLFNPKLGPPLNVTDTQYSAKQSLTVGSLTNLIQALENGINTGFKDETGNTTNAINSLSATTAKASDLTALSASVNTLTNTVNTLNSNLSTTTDVAYVAIAVAIILGIAAIALSRRKPS
jgi:hypothetical protein